MASTFLILDFAIGTESDYGKYFIIPEFPDLDIIYKNSINSLCPNVYGGSMVCFRRGGITMKFTINGVDFEIKSEDGKNTKFEIDTKIHHYIFEAIKTYVGDKHTFLVIKIIQNGKTNV